MSLYDDIDVDSSKSKGENPSLSSGSTASKINLNFLKTQLEAKRALLQNAQKSSNPQPAPVIDLSAQQKTKSLLNLKPRKAVPLPVDSLSGFTIVPKALKEDKVFLFGEITIEDEYNPTAPTDYASFKQKREAQRIKEKIAKEIAERIQREHSEEESKRITGAAIAPPQVLIEQDQIVSSSPPSSSSSVLDATSQFGKSATRGLGVAANIMSKMGYRQGFGLGRLQQGMSTALRVEQTGKKTGLILSEYQDHKESSVEDDSELWSSEWTTERQDTQQALSTIGNESSDNIAPQKNVTELLRDSTKVVLLKNMVAPSEVDPELESEVRDEMKKYGQLNNVIIHAIPSAPVDEAVRIFLEFTNTAQAIKAVIDLNGRFFGGRAIHATFYNVDDFTNRRLEK